MLIDNYPVDQSSVWTTLQTGVSVNSDKLADAL